MSEQRPVHELALDLLVYAPVGLVLVAADEVPRLAERGRAQLGPRIAMARTIGKFVATTGYSKMSGGRPSSRTASPSGASATRRPAEPGVPPSARDRGGARRPGTGADARGASHGGRASLDTGTELAIPGYDTLAASQVVERLASLSPNELERVRTHEAATRRRRTVLHRIAQLMSDEGRSPG